MRAIALLSCLLLTLGSGCLDGSDSDSSSSGDGADAPAPSAVSQRTGTMDLGSAKGSSLTPARFDFTVAVPAGGATSVQWQMTVEGPASNNLANHVEGPGCDNGGGNVAVSISVLGTSTFSASCADLPEGEHTFTAVLGSPTLAFTAKVSGSVAQAVPAAAV